MLGKLSRYPDSCSSASSCPAWKLHAVWGQAFLYITVALRYVVWVGYS